MQIEDEVVEPYKMSVNMVKTNKPEFIVHESRLPSSSELSVCSSYEEYVQTLINETPVQESVSTKLLI